MRDRLGITRIRENLQAAVLGSSPDPRGGELIALHRDHYLAWIGLLLPCNNSPQSLVFQTSSFSHYVVSPRSPVINKRAKDRARSYDASAAASV